MSAIVADLLADLLGPVPEKTPAKVANPAKTRAGIDSAADNAVCEGLRIPANLQPQRADAKPDSQTFAGIRNPNIAPESEYPCASSQDSQDSQGVPGITVSTDDVAGTPDDEGREGGSKPVRAPARARRAELYAPAREAMHRLGYCDGEAEDQLQAVLQTLPAETVAADLQAIGDERGLPPTVDPVQELYAERLKRRGLPPAVIASLAPILAQRDRDCVDLRSCAECARFARIPSSRVAAWHCQHPSTPIKFGCHGPDVLFRCDGFLGCR